MRGNENARHGRAFSRSDGASVPVVERAAQADEHLLRLLAEPAFGDDAPEFYLEAARAAAASEDYDHDAFVAKVSEAAAVRRSAEGAGEPNLGNGVAQESTVTKRSAEDIIMALQQG